MTCNYDSNRSSSSRSDDNDGWMDGWMMMIIKIM
jgi:hypothetical protein